METSPLERVNSYSWYNYSHIWFQFPTKVDIQREIKGYHDLSYMAEVGGYVGLFLGYSVLHVLGYVSVGVEFLFNKINMIIAHGSVAPRR